MTALAKRRRAAANAQSLRCHYCGLPMWESDPNGFAKRYRLSRAQATLLRSTAEHLVARCDGGSDAPSNIVAAHEYCNRLRHTRRNPAPPQRYQEFVLARMRAGRWLAGILPGHFVERSRVPNKGIQQTAKR